jgi:hypothetical protein
LLGYQELEFPVVDSTRIRNQPALRADATHVPPAIEVEPQETVELWLLFSPGTPILSRATLHLRSLQRDGRHLEVLALPVPGQPERPET